MVCNTPTDQRENMFDMREATLLYAPGKVMVIFSHLCYGGKFVSLVGSLSGKQ